MMIHDYEPLFSHSNFCQTFVNAEVCDVSWLINPTDKEIRLLDITDFEDEELNIQNELQSSCHQDDLFKLALIIYKKYDREQTEKAVKIFQDLSNKGYVRKLL